MRIICLTTVVAPLALSWISKYAYKILLFKHPFKMHSDVTWECGQIMFLAIVRISASMYASQLFATKIYDFAILQSDWSILKAQLLSLKEEKISFEQVNKLKFIIYMPPPVFNIFMDKKSFCS